MSEVTSELRVLAMYGVFAIARRPLRMTELASELQIAPSSCLSLIRRLVAEGYLYEVTERGGYYPTEKLSEHTKKVSAHHPVLIHLGEALQTLHGRTNETVTLCRRDGPDVLYLAAYESLQEIRLTGKIGQRKPLHGNAAGKALFGELSSMERRVILESAGYLKEGRLVQIGDKTLPTLAALEEDIERSEARGWHQSDSESTAGSLGVATRIVVGDVAYSIQVAGPRDRMTAERDRVAARLMETAETVYATLRGDVR